MTEFSATGDQSQPRAAVDRSNDRAGACIIWPHPVTAVAFDMDGLMVNTEELYTVVGQTILSRRGRTFTPELKRSIMGLPGNRAFAFIIEHEKLEDSVEILAQESDEVFAELLPTRVRALPGLLQLLDRLDLLQLPRCVATSSSRRFACDVLQRVSILERVDFVITADDVAQGKPAPDIYLQAATRMHVHPRNMLVLEDSHHGTRAGIAFGACTIAVPGDHSADHDFQGVHQVASGLNDPCIANVLSKSPQR